MSADSSAALPPGYGAATPSADLASFPVIVDQHWAAAHKAHMHRRNQMHAHNQSLGAVSPASREREVK